MSFFLDVINVLSLKKICTTQNFIQFNLIVTLFTAKTFITITFTAGMTSRFCSTEYLV